MYKVMLLKAKERSKFWCDPKYCLMTPDSKTPLSTDDRKAGNEKLTALHKSAQDAQDSTVAKAEYEIVSSLT